MDPGERCRICNKNHTEEDYCMGCSLFHAPKGARPSLTRGRDHFVQCNICATVGGTWRAVMLLRAKKYLAAALGYVATAPRAQTMRKAFPLLLLLLPHVSVLSN